MNSYYSLNIELSYFTIISLLNESETNHVLSFHLLENKYMNF